MTSIAVLLILGMGWQEIMLVVFLVLLLFGAKRIPELAKGLGRGIKEFKDASKEIKSEISKGMEEDSSSEKKS